MFITKDNNNKESTNINNLMELDIILLFILKELIITKELVNTDLEEMICKD